MVPSPYHHIYKYIIYIGILHELDKGLFYHSFCLLMIFYPRAHTFYPEVKSNRLSGPMYPFRRRVVEDLGPYLKIKFRFENQMDFSEKQACFSPKTPPLETKIIQ